MPFTAHQFSYHDTHTLLCSSHLVNQNPKNINPFIAVHNLCFVLRSPTASLLCCGDAVCIMHGIVRKISQTSIILHMKMSSVQISLSTVPPLPNLPHAPHHPATIPHVSAALSAPRSPPASHPVPSPHKSSDPHHPADARPRSTDNSRTAGLGRVGWR